MMKLCWVTGLVQVAALGEGGGAECQAVAALAAGATCSWARSMSSALGITLTVANVREHTSQTPKIHP